VKHGCQRILLQCCFLLSLGWSLPSQALPERILCWLVDSSIGGQIVADDKSTRWPQLFRDQQTTNYRFIFPIMDLDEASQIQPTTIENAFMTPLLMTSQRYDADKLLLGQLLQKDGEWTLNWQLHQARGDGGVIIRGQARGMQNQLIFQVVTALDAYLQERNSVMVNNYVYSSTQHY
jgi:hypothetical protein